MTWRRALRRAHLRLETIARRDERPSHYRASWESATIASGRTAGGGMRRPLPRATRERSHHSGGRNLTDRVVTVAGAGSGYLKAACKTACSRGTTPRAPVVGELPGNTSRAARGEAAWRGYAVRGHAAWASLRGGHLRTQGSLLGVLGSPTAPGVPSTADLIDYVESIANASSTDVR